MIWVGVGFLCATEFLFGVLTVNIFARAKCQYRPSGAVLAITYKMVGAFAMSGILSIVVYWIVRDKDGTKDGLFTAVLMAITTFWFIVAFLLYANDLRTQAADRPAQEKRGEHKGYARNIKAALIGIRSVRTDSVERRRSLEVIAKKLEAIDVALSHSHGGGASSWEAPPSCSSNAGQDQVIQASIGTLESLLPELCKSGCTEFGPVDAELEQCVARLSSAVNALGIE